MEVVEIRQADALDERLRQELPFLIREAWRKVYQNMEAYTEAYEVDESIWGLGMIEHELAKGNRLFVAWEAGHAVATVLVDAVTHEGAPALQLRTLAVHPDTQGRGLAERMIDHIMAVGAREGKAFLTLYTSSLLTGLVRFYGRIGFAEYKREEVERFGKRYARVFFRRAIPNTC